MDSQHISGFIYYPPKDRCYPPYRQGPCPKKQHLILLAGRVIPQCVRNPCQDGFAKSVVHKYHRFAIQSLIFQI